MATPSHASAEAAKKAAGYKAAEFVNDGMHVGLGTGSTAAFFIEALIQRCRQGLQIKAIATSEKSQAQAIAGGIPLLPADQATALDIAVDGADEIDTQKRMIKGGGGALLREKIIATMSKEMIVIVDRSKCVPLLGKFPLAVEIVPFAHQATIKALNDKGYKGQLRMHEGSPYKTDNQHFIYDIHFERPIDNPEYHEALIRPIPGVVTTGFFFNLAGRVIIGDTDGTVEIIR